MALPSFDEIFQQFNVDSPRVQFFLDGVCERQSDVVLTCLMNRAADRGGTDGDRARGFDEGVRSLFWCTQTALAPLYIDKWSEIVTQRGDAFHLVDDGKQVIRITDDDIRITKPFRILKEEVVACNDGGLSTSGSMCTSMVVQDRVELAVHVHRNGRVRTKWQRPRPKKRREQWCLIQVAGLTPDL
jgi:hypothetical protein